MSTIKKKKMAISLIFGGRFFFQLGGIDYGIWNSKPAQIFQKCFSKTILMITIVFFLVFSTLN